MPPRKVAPKAAPKAAPKKTLVKAKGPVVKNPFKTTHHIQEPGKFIILYGPPGEGKTTVAAFTPDPLFVHTSDEQGIIQALIYKVVPPNLKDWLVELPPPCDAGNIPDGDGVPGWNTLMETVHLFETGEHDRRTLVLDSLTGMETLAFQQSASKLYKGDMTDPQGYMNYYAGYRKADEQFWQQELMTSLSRIVAKGYNVVMICHSELKHQPNPAGDEYAIFAPSLDKRIWNTTKRAVQGIFFLGRSQSLSKDKNRKTKATAEHRFIGVAKTHWYEAKNWFNMEGIVDVGSSAAETWKHLNAKLQMK